MPTVQPVITIAGERVALGPLRLDLIPLYHAWINNVETTQYLSEAGSAPTLDEEIDWYGRANRMDILAEEFTASRLAVRPATLDRSR